MRTARQWRPVAVVDVHDTQTGEQLAQLRSGPPCRRRHPRSPPKPAHRSLGLRQASRQHVQGPSMPAQRSTPASATAQLPQPAAGRSTPHIHQQDRRQALPSAEPGAPSWATPVCCGCLPQTMPHEQAPARTPAPEKVPKHEARSLTVRKMAGWARFGGTAPARWLASSADTRVTRAKHRSAPKAAEDGADLAGLCLSPELLRPCQERRSAQVQLGQSVESIHPPAAPGRTLPVIAGSHGSAVCAPQPFPRC